MVLEAPQKSEEIPVEIRGDCMTVVDWITGKARQRATRKAVGNVRVVEQGSLILRRRECTSS